MKNIFVLMALVFLVSHPFKSEATVYSNYPTNCLIVKATTSAQQGFLCIEDIGKLTYGSTQVGDQLNAYLYTNGIYSTRILIPLEVSRIGSLDVGRYSLDTLIDLSGSSGEYQIQISFSARKRNELPVYFQGNGFIMGREGNQIIDRYVWEESNTPAEPYECVPGHSCKI